TAGVDARSEDTNGCTAVGNACRKSACRGDECTASFWPDTSEALSLAPRSAKTTIGRKVVLIGEGVGAKTGCSLAERSECNETVGGSSCVASESRTHVRLVPRGEGAVVSASTEDAEEAKESAPARGTAGA